MPRLIYLFRSRHFIKCHCIFRFSISFYQMQYLSSIEWVYSLNCILKERTLKIDTLEIQFSYATESKLFSLKINIFFYLFKINKKLIVFSSFFYLFNQMYLDYHKNGINYVEDVRHSKQYLDPHH